MTEMPLSELSGQVEILRLRLAHMQEMLDRREGVEWREFHRQRAEAMKEADKVSQLLSLRSAMLPEEKQG